MKSTFYFFLCLSLLTNCQNPQEDLTDQIRQTEKAFNDMAQKRGVKEAFLHFAADSAVIVRGENVIQSEGIFHTVWKKQPDGEWRFVYD